MLDVRAIAPRWTLPRARLRIDARHVPRLRRLSIAATIGILLGVLLSNVSLWTLVHDEMGVDLNYFRFYAELWTEGRGFYLPNELAGPYQADVGYGNYYPPFALFLFVPFVDVVPAPLWWAIPSASRRCPCGRGNRHSGRGPSWP